MRRRITKTLLWQEHVVTICLRPSNSIMFVCVGQHHLSHVNYVCVRGVRRLPLNFMEQIFPFLRPLRFFPLPSSSSTFSHPSPVPCPFFLSPIPFLISLNFPQIQLGRLGSGVSLKWCILSEKFGHLVRIILVTFMKNYIDFPHVSGKTSPIFSGAFSPTFI